MTGFSTARLHFLNILITCLILLSGCNTSTSNTNSVDSKQKDSISIWINWVKEHKDLPLESKKLALEKALLYTDKNLPDTLKTKKYSQISLIYKRLSDTTNFKRVNQKLIVLSKRINDWQAHGEAHWDLGDYYKITKPDSSYYHYREAHTIFLNADLNESASDYPGRVLYAMALVKDNIKDYVGAEKDIIQAITFYKENGHKERLFSAYNLLANTQNGLNKFHKALEYNQIASDYIQFNNQEKQYRDSIYIKTNRAIAHIRNGDYARGIQILRQNLATDSFELKEPQAYAKALASLAHGKFQNGDTDTEDIKKLLHESDKILDSLGDSYHKARNHEFLAQVLTFENDTSEAIKEALFAKAIAQETNNNDRLLSTLQLLTKIDKENSAAHANTYFTLNDSLQTQERNIRDKFARIEMETDEIIEENEVLSRQIQTWIGIAIGLLLFGTAIFVIRTQRINNQKLKFKQKQQESNQEIYNLMLSQQAKFQEGKQLEQKRVSEELHDGILGQMLGIRLILSGLNERDDEAAVTQRAELIEKLQELEEEIRTISHELNDASYQKIHNFILAIDDLVQTIGASAQLQSSFSHDENMDWDALNGETKINIYRIVQECLQNCVKHAQCSSVNVDFKSKPESLSVSIVDDGRGFDKNKGKKGIGMKNILSRVEKMSGSLQIDSKIGKGTKITITVPQQEQTKEKLKAKTVLEV